MSKIEASPSVGSSLKVNSECEGGGVGFFLQSRGQPRMADQARGVSEELLRQMRCRVEQLDPPSKGVDDSTLKRFLRARDLNVEKASNFFMHHQQWRRSFVPNGHILEEQIPNELNHKKVFLQGHDKHGHPLGVIIARHHESSKSDLEELKRLVVYTFDKVISSLPDGEEKFVFIVDIEGWSYKNMDLRAYVAILEILQDHYPERLGKLYMIHVPYIFWGAWKIIYPFIDKFTREKIAIIENKKLATFLKEEIGEEHLPDIYGGKLPLIPIQDFILPN